MKLAGLHFDRLQGRTQSTFPDDPEVLLLCPEVYLHLIGLHLQRDEDRRPLWWCNIGATVEAPLLLNEEYVLHNGRHRTARLVCAVCARHKLFDARNRHTPPRRMAGGRAARTLPTA